MGGERTRGERREELGMSRFNRFHDVDTICDLSGFKHGRDTETNI